MARGSDLLDDKTVKAKTAPGHYRDGRGLFLQVSKWGTKSWVFRYTSRGKARGMGLGSYEDVSLKDARNEVDNLRVAVREGRDPVEERRKLNAAPDAAKAVTFADALDEYMQSDYIQKTLSSDKHRKQWRASLDLHVVPKMGAKDVGTVTIDDVKEVLKPIWATKTDTARRVRQRIESVFAWAIDEGSRETDNPASTKVLQIWIKNQKKAEAQNFAAIQQDDLPTWFAELEKREGMAARALTFLTLCANRSGEIRGATWGEIDLKSKIFTVPAARAKMRKPHVVAMPEAAVALLKSLPNFEADHNNPNALIFPAPRGGEMSDATMSAVMKRMHETKAKKDGKGWIDPQVLTQSDDPEEVRLPKPAVPHGLRSSFKDFCARRGFDNILSELALSHNVGTEVERRYRRDDLVEERRAMMNAFAAFCRGEETEASKVVPLRAGVA
ncbi:tyrosine-type recombinase/integrase [Sulfitobacter sp. BSw21498]|uniref:tyrosine-type recombinase/integrase n=1 Tax=Sulfitobacter sp. BSw21498 TaxID=664426 RepID=UPI001110DCFD|nr:site-specific integrase [Sulfitobacter sp. BSw21498]